MFKKCCSPKSWKYNDIVGTVVLLLLNIKSDYGYNIMNRVSDVLGYSPSLNGLIYRILSFFEESGFVHSEWNIPEVSLPKKIYNLTPDGKRYLRDKMTTINSQIVLLNKIVQLYIGEIQ